MGFQRRSLVFRMDRMKRFLRHSLELHRSQIRMEQPFRRHTMDQLHHQIRTKPFRLRTMDPQPKYRSTSWMLRNHVRQVGDSIGRRRSFVHRGLHLGRTNQLQYSFSSSQISLRILFTDNCSQANLDGCFETDFGARSRRRNRPQLAWHVALCRSRVPLTSFASLLK